MLTTTVLLALNVLLLITVPNTHPLPENKYCNNQAIFIDHTYKIQLNNHVITNYTHVLYKYLKNSFLEVDQWLRA